MTKIVYHPHYNIGFFGIENLHPFDSKKYGRSYRTLQKQFGEQLDEHLLQPAHPVRRATLLQVHSPSYLEQLASAHYAAQVLEIPPIRYLPGRLVDTLVLKRMRWATQGTILAAQAAFSSGLVVNLAGGYHHAKPNAGEGFCAYADIALAITTARNEGLLGKTDNVAYIDLDAHQGNGVCHCFLDDNSIHIFDMYNQDIYPAHDIIARQRIDWDVPLSTGCTTQPYLDTLKRELPNFLASLENDSKAPSFAIYNAGTDIFEQDPLGQLGVSEAGILERDLFVINLLRQKEIPTIMLLSGGYTDQSYQLVANTVQQLLQDEMG